MAQEYSTEATELYNFAVNESTLHRWRQIAVNSAQSENIVIARIAAADTVRIAWQAAIAYPGGECFTTEHILEAALMLHREDMKAVAEDYANGGKGEL